MTPPAHPAFQALTLRFNGVAGQLISDVTVTPAFDPTSPPANIPAIATRALWDTGASKSVISPHVVSALGLAPVGTAKVAHAAGSSMSPTYMVHFRLPNSVEFAGLLVSEFSSMGGGFEAIIGMDVLVMGDFSLTNVGGKTCMSFRTPSCAQVDFVAVANRLTFAGVGRNDPCPCGSKKKFKQCHGAPGAVP